MTATKQFVRSDFDCLLQSFVDENQFPWLDPSLHERYFCLVLFSNNHIYSDN